MKTPLLLALGIAVATNLWAQPHAAEGEITRIDRGAARVTLRHGEIRNLEMPPMTMTYRVKEARLLDGMAVGDRVRFTADRIDGQYTVTSLAKQR